MKVKAATDKGIDVKKAIIEAVQELAPGKIKFRKKLLRPSSKGQSPGPALIALNGRASLPGWKS